MEQLQKKLLHPLQLELLYKSALQSLRNDNIAYDNKHDILSTSIIPDRDSVELLDTIETLYDLLVASGEYDLEELEENE